MKPSRNCLPLVLALTFGCNGGGGSAVDAGDDGAQPKDGPSSKDSDPIPDVSDDVCDFSLSQPASGSAAVYLNVNGMSGIVGDKIAWQAQTAGNYAFIKSTVVPPAGFFCDSFLSLDPGLTYDKLIVAFDVNENAACDDGTDVLLQATPPAFVDDKTRVDLDYTATSDATCAEWFGPFPP